MHFAVLLEFFRFPFVSLDLAILEKSSMIFLQYSARLEKDCMFLTFLM